MTAQSPFRAKAPPAGRRFGYVVAAAVNVGLLYVVSNLLDWDLLPFLTGSFDRVVPIISISLAANVAVNLFYIFHDAMPLKSLTQIGLLGINMVATVRVFQVFPFDFSEYDFGWATVARALLIISMIGIVIGVIVELAKLRRSQAAS